MGKYLFLRHFAQTLLCSLNMPWPWANSLPQPFHSVNKLLQMYMIWLVLCARLSNDAHRHYEWCPCSADCQNVGNGLYLTWDLCVYVGSCCQRCSVWWPWRRIRATGISARHSSITIPKLWPATATESAGPLSVGTATICWVCTEPGGYHSVPGIQWGTQAVQTGKWWEVKVKCVVP